MNYKRLLLVLLSFFLLITSGCFGPVKTKQANTFTLNTVSSQIPVSKNTGKTILVSIPRAEPGYATNKMAYILNNPYEIRYFAQNKWVQPPNNLILPLIVESLQKTNAYHAVATPPFSTLTDLRLDTDLIQLQQDFSTSPSKVTVKLKAQLVDSETQSVIASNTFIVTRTAPSNDPAGGVKAANDAVAEALRQMSVFLIHWNKG